MEPKRKKSNSNKKLHPVFLHGFWLFVDIFLIKLLMNMDRKKYVFIPNNQNNRNNRNNKFIYKDFLPVGPPNVSRSCSLNVIMASMFYAL